MFTKENETHAKIQWVLKTVESKFRFVLVRVPMDFFVKCFLTVKLYIVLVFQEQNLIIFLFRSFF